MSKDKIIQKILENLLEKFGVKMGDAAYTGPGVPDEGDIKGGIYDKKLRKKKKLIVK